MTKLKAIERDVERLSPEELARFRGWFMEYDGDAWDWRIEADAKNGKLDALAAKAREAHARGESRPL